MSPRTITAFLFTQMTKGTFRSHEPAKAFFVDVSVQLNTPSVIFAGKLIACIGLATNKPAEFIVLRFSQVTRALEAELAAWVLPVQAWGLTATLGCVAHAHHRLGATLEIAVDRTS
ncbi:MAG: hypothetical protein ABIJ09_17480 [Pseudomonadota bacterium]